MRRNLFVLWVAVLATMGLVAAACGDDGDDAAPAAPPPAPAPAAEEPAEPPPAPEPAPAPPEPAPAAPEPAPPEPAPEPAPPEPPPPPAEPMEPTDMTLALPWIKNSQFSGTFIGLDRGYFEENGVNLTVNAGGFNAPDSVVSVIAGDAQVGMSAGLINLFTAINEGNDLVIIGTKYQKDPLGLVSLADRPVVVPEDLIGATILGQPTIPRLIDALFTINDLGDPDYEFVPAGFDIQPLVDGDGDAYSAFIFSQPVTLEVQHGMVAGEDYFAVSLSDFGLPQYTHVVFTRRDWLEANRDAAVGFMAALIQGWNDNAADTTVGPNLAANEFGVDLGLDLATELRINELQLPLMTSELTDANGLFWVSEEYLEGPVYAGLKTAGFEVPEDIGPYIDNSIITDAVARLGG